MAKGRETGWLRASAAAGIVLGAAFLAYARWVERLRVEVKRLRVAVQSPGLPERGLRVLHLSDLHLTGQDRLEAIKMERTRKLLAGEQFDLLLISGDLIHDDGGLPAAVAFIKALPRPRLGAFACLGNHDYAGYTWLGPARQAWQQAEPGRQAQAAVRKVVEMLIRIVRNDRLYLGTERNDVSALAAALTDCGVRLLRNDNTSVQAPGTNLWLAGVDDLMEGQLDLEGTLAGRPDAGALRILLAHNPDWLLETQLQHFDLAFSGHVHGGQIKLPWLGAPHTQGTHLSRRRTAGWFRYGNTQAYVSRGLGEGVRLRFRCRPEVTLIDIVPVL